MPREPKLVGRDDVSDAEIESAVDRALDRLAARGLVEKTAGDGYRLTDTGEAYVEEVLLPWFRRGRPRA